jgi:RNA polymerase sigma-70 factor, ECF subfamily
LAACLTRLPDDQREAVMRHHLQGWSLAELAAHLQRSEGAVAGLLHRGLKQLKQMLSESDGELSRRERQ